MSEFSSVQAAFRRRLPTHRESGRGFVRILEGGRVPRHRGFVAGTILPGSAFHESGAAVIPRYQPGDSVSGNRRDTVPRARTGRSRTDDHLSTLQRALRDTSRRTKRSLRFRFGLLADRLAEIFHDAARSIPARRRSLARDIAAAGAHIASGLPAAFRSCPERPAFRGSLLEPRWMAFVDSVPRTVASATEVVRTRLTRSPLRTAGIAAVLLAVLLALRFADGFASMPPFPLSGPELFAVEPSAQEVLLAYMTPELSPESDTTDLSRLPSLPVSMETRSYRVRGNDTVASVAKRFGLRQDTIISVNNLKNVSSFKTGMMLEVPNMDGVRYRIRSGDSLPLIARKHGVDIIKLADANNLSSDIIHAGKDLFIPGARLPAATLQSFHGEFMVWPVRGPVSSSFGYRSNPFTGLRTFHAGIDIVVQPGTPVKSMMNGTVAETGYNNVFGHYVIISHPENFQSLYGHLSSIGVRKGQSLGQGIVLGRSGNSGYSTGPHLHLGLFRRGSAVNPRTYLK